METVDTVETVEAETPEQTTPGTPKLLFNLYDVGEVEIADPALHRYVNLHSMIVPHSCGKLNGGEFGKSHMLVVERLINRLMQSEDNTGKKQLAIRIVKDAFAIVAKRTKRNPVQVLVEAVANAGPREETVRLKYGGINVPKSVDTAPQRRVDSALKFITEGVQKNSRGKKSVATALADELIAASKGDVKAYSVAKKEERERIAKSAR
jgi:small subunit ribosomal protein S7